MKKISLLCMILVVFSVLLSACGFGPSSALSGPKDSGTIVVGSKNFSENIIVGDMEYYLLKAKLKGVNVENKPNLGSTAVLWNALQSGQLDTYVDYTGTGLVDIMKMPVTHDPDEAYQTVKKEYPTRYHIDWLNPMGFNDTYAVAVPKTIAEKYHLKKISDLAPVASQLVFGGEPDYFTRPDAYPGLSKTYGLHFQSLKQIDVGLKYQAAANNQVQVLDVYSTDGNLIRYGMTVLEDDKHFFPPYYAAPIVRESTLKAHPEISSILNSLQNTLTDSSMQQLNYQVDVQHKSPDDVAQQFLKSKGLL
ncbi:glycine betaine ABC transporter substrate-binding protein [Ktedonospora formicarum]|uniref:Glycine/betaine ABC transporter substrate-binding protein n=1 Tax=Ktedonospora formicarum TaxID=2778364 RepID=A0A8J3MRH5_9CHLR|nr:glycine betaine ABC transporter substrate-binding protein [Ktedonospora formicarum]GHO45055.1 glycine/betaine ABC transporter substrate-binding protein [Ktedonospora formicarum]